MADLYSYLHVELDRRITLMDPALLALIDSAIGSFEEKICDVTLVTDRQSEEIAVLRAEIDKLRASDDAENLRRSNSLNDTLSQQIHTLKTRIEDLTLELADAFEEGEKARKQMAAASADDSKGGAQSEAPLSNSDTSQTVPQGRAADAILPDGRLWLPEFSEGKVCLLCPDPGCDGQGENGLTCSFIESASNDHQIAGEPAEAQIAVCHQIPVKDDSTPSGTVESMCPPPVPSTSAPQGGEELRHIPNPKLGTTTERVLRALREGCTTQKQIQERTGLAQCAVSVAVRSLIGAGTIQQTKERMIGKKDSNEYTVPDPSGYRHLLTPETRSRLEARD